MMKLKQRVVMLLVLAVVACVVVMVRVHLACSREEVVPSSEVVHSPSATGGKSTLHQTPHTNISHSENPRPGATRNDARPKVSPLVSSEDAWTIWEGWVQPDFLYPQDAFYSEEMNHILAAMATSPITSFGVGHKGTQLKATVMMGPQRAVFKPKRYERDYVVPGGPYAGFDRHTGEIAGFHLDGILGFRIAPPVVGRILNLTALRRVTSEKLNRTYLKDGDGNVCFYGVCYYCKPAEAACASGEMMEGSLTLWLPKWYDLVTRRHPYQRTYVEGRKARWEKDATFCHDRLLEPTSEYYHGILEFTDAAIFDFLMANADRHHYETFSRSKPHGKMMHIDNGKTFGDPGHDEMSILAPLEQCCRVRRSTWARLEEFSATGDAKLSEALEASLQRDPLTPILTRPHLDAIDRRLQRIMETIRICLERYSRDVVLVDSWG